MTISLDFLLSSLADGLLLGFVYGVAAMGLTLIWVTHNPDQAKRIADRVVLLVNGRLEDEGTPEHLFREGSTHLTATFAAGDLE